MFQILASAIYKHIFKKTVNKGSPFLGRFGESDEISLNPVST